MSKKFVSLLFCLIFCFCMFATSAFAFVPFVDVPTNHWAYDAVQTMQSKDLMAGTGDNNFGGTLPLTRAMMVTVMAKYAGAELGSIDESVFPDVPTGKYYTAQVNWAYNNKIVSGNDKGLFDPDGVVTREQAYVMVRALSNFLYELSGNADRSALLLFYDEWEVAEYAKDAMAWAINYGLCTGNGEAVLPKKDITRYEIACIFNSFLNYDSKNHLPFPVPYKVTFLDYDGKTIAQYYVESGKYAKYRLTDPYRESDATYKYTFTGWDKPLGPIYSETQIHATYQKELLGPQTTKGYPILHENGAYYVQVGSYKILVANKSYALDSSYNPGGLTNETQVAFNELKKAASKAGYSLWIASGFRSYSYQQSVYQKWVNKYGKTQADRISARPGYSEHQTGLAIDVNELEESFGNTATGKWLAANAHRFGFIIRYGKNKEGYTGYSYEPWHIRYVGSIATSIYESGLSLEEYLGITSKY